MKVFTDRLNKNIPFLTYNRALLKSKIVHLGFGAFHRAHQGVFIELLARETNDDWGVCVASLHNVSSIQKLREQQHYYTVTTKNERSTQSQLIGTVIESIHPSLDGKNALVEKIAEPQVAIISLTITEKGYCLDPATGKLNLKHPSIVQDLININTPSSAIGYIVRALKLRRARGLNPVSILSCDNIPENGHTARAAILEFTKQLDTGLAEWISSNISFPNTMVDRITPAMADADYIEIERLISTKDQCAVICEPFNQWVIEDDFAAGRPDWNLVGAQFVDNVLPYEEMKLRMLNGAHSFLAYLGYLAGYQYVSDTMRNPCFEKAARRLMMAEQAPSLSMPGGTDLNSYADQVISRFSNPNLQHKTWQIAMDGSQKLPQRLGASLRYQIENELSIVHIGTGIAAWMRYVSGQDENGSVIDVQDPMAGELQNICDKHGLNVSVVPALLAVKAVFDPVIANNQRVIDTVSHVYQSLVDNGTLVTVEKLAEGEL